MVDTRLAAYVIWGLGTVAVYGVVLVRRYAEYGQRRDARAKRELMESIASFITSLAALLAITLVLFGPSGTGIRGTFTAIALGAFFAAGLIQALERTPAKPLVRRRR